MPAPAAWTMLVEWPLERSLPWTFPVDLGQEPLIWSTREDVSRVGTLEPVERRLVTAPVIRRALTDVLGGPERAEQVEITLRRRDAGSIVPELGVITETKELRGKLLSVYVADLAAPTPAPHRLLNGTIATWTLSAGQCALLVTALDASAMTDLVPTALISTRAYPYAAPAAEAPAGGVGSAVALGMGLGRRVPCRNLRRLVEVDTFFEAPVELVVPADNVLLISDHEAETGQGPYRLVTTGTLPGGIEPERQYWLILVDEDRLQLATSYANAIAGAAVDLTDAGTGTLRLRGGLPPQLAPEWDYAVAIGNYAIHHVYDSADPSPMVPGMDWIALRGVYRVGGSPVTAIRLLEDPATDPITADILRLPDLDHQVAAEWHWTGDFRDALGGGADWLSATINTADLVPGPTGVGLGAIRFASDSGFLEQAGPGTAWEDVLVFGGTLEVLARSRHPTTATGLFWIAQLGRDAAGEASLYLFDDRTAAAPVVLLRCADNSVQVLGGPAGSWPANAWTHVAVIVLPTEVRLVINGQVAASVVLPAPVRVPAEPWTTRLGMPGSGFIGDLGWLRLSRGDRDLATLRYAYFILRRNPVIAAREFARATGHPLDEASWLATAEVLDAVEAGALHADCVVTEQSQLRDVLAAFAPFRELRWFVDAAGRLSIACALPPATPALTLREDGSGDVALSLTQETIASATEAYRRLPVSFFGLRDEAGTFTRYGVTLTRDVCPVGTLETPLELPFVDDPVTADIIADFRAKRLMRQERARQATLGRDADVLVPASVVAWDRAGVLDPWAVLDVQRAAASSDARLVPTSAEDFVYTPAALPALPVEGATLLGELGNISTLAVTAESPRTIRVTPVLAHRVFSYPVAMTDPTGYVATVGAADPVLAVQFAPPSAYDQDYIQMQPGAVVLYRFSPMVLPVGMHGFVAKRVELIAGLRQHVTGPLDVGYVYRRPNQSAPATIYPLAVVSGTYPADYWQGLAGVAPAPAPADTATWTLPDFAAFEGGLATSQAVDLSMLLVRVEVTLEPPAVGLGWIRYWAAPTGQTAPLDETSPPIAASRDFGPVKFQVPTAGAWTVFARVYDFDGRFVGNLGPVDVTVPA